MKILLTGGGTAGHALPIVLIAKSLLKNKRVRILYVGSRQGIEKKLAGESAIPFKSIVTGKRRAYFSLSNFWDLFKALIGILQSYWIILTFKPDVIFSKGGYVSFPLVWWAGVLKLPLVIHESDVVLGRANLWATKLARRICLGFPLKYYQEKLPIDKLKYTGTPVSREFAYTPVNIENRGRIVITGGSQGSSRINQVISEIIRGLLNEYEVWHFAGDRDFESLSKIQDKYYHLFNFSNQLPQILRNSDLVISRAGAGTLAEIAASGKASILIPLPTAASNHQMENARVFESQNAAVIISEKNLTGSGLNSVIDNLMKDNKLRELIGHHAKSLYHPNSEQEIIDVIFEAANKNGK